MPQVSRLTSGGKLVVDGKPACVKCGRRPQRWSGKRWQSYCGPCHTYDQWQRRLGKTELLIRDEDRGLHVAIRGAQLSAEERDVIIDTILEMRARPSGRHHAGLSQMRILAGLIVKGIAIGVLSYPLGVMVNVMIR